MKWFLIFFVFLFLGCTQTVEQPEGLIDEKKMVEILSDIYLHQQTSYLTEIKNNKPDFAKIDAYLIEKHGATLSNFEESYKFYVLNPEKYNQLLMQVREDLEHRLPEKERLKREEERKKSETDKK